MSNYQTAAYTDTGTKASINLDPSIAPFNTSVVVTVGTSGTYGLQYSLDPMTVTDANALWSDSVNIPSGSTTTKVTNFMFPVSRIRVVIVANGGTITLQALQGFTIN